MNLVYTLCQVQCQASKLEVMEYLFQSVNSAQPNLDCEILINMISTLKQNLLRDSEKCLDLLLKTTSPDDLTRATRTLRSTVISVNNLLIKMSSGLTTPETIVLKEILMNIITSLMAINSDLEAQSETSINLLSNWSIENQASKNDIDIELEQMKIAVSSSESMLGQLRQKCMGNTEQVERLIQYELQKNPQMSRDDAIQSAIIRWELDNL
ncbi:hypothetical protein ACN4EG_15370 [Alkalinema pantanalense CENA528]|uniref:hypothetical protein n=1 Tax=Alkalinema pantanalense TaxID=1620705 RepID=UPI003D700E45